VTLNLAVGRCILGLGLAAPLVRAASAQAPRVLVGAGPAVGRATRSLGQYMGGGWGAGGFVAFGSAAGPVRLRVDADYVRFAPTTAARPYRAALPVFITSGSQLFAATAGPEVRVPLGRVRVSAGAGAGFVASTNTGAVSGIGTDARFSGATAFSDLTLAYAGGGGLGLDLGGERTPVWLDLSARYLGTGPTRWVREGNIPVGYISGVYLKPTRSPTTVVVYRLAVSVGVPR
jgi:hypothetical protein